MAVRSYAAAAGARLAAAGAREDLVVVYPWLLLQDEASMRLRSFQDPGNKKPSRSRSSKVQEYNSSLLAEDLLELYTELDALGNKTAETIATSFDRQLRHVAGIVRQAIGDTAPINREYWLVEILVGDGIGTNEKAARIQLGEAWANPPFQGTTARILYFLMVLKCATHQVQRTAMSHTEGACAKLGSMNQRAASSAEGAAVGAMRADLGKRGMHTHACGACVRLFKYLVNDYYEEFYANLKVHVSSKLTVVSAARGGG